ncbi:DUF1385 domain-containing protein [Sporolactobacillus pectinivorans]|uniref:DUF1385 domain-containing protein n=1 Tax=Sporolactobacillus pectinivorans TaxID=1591408 RepID=UPI000C2601AF
MSSNAFDHLKSLELRDITRQSRIHEHCGTNLLVYVLFLTTILFLCLHSYSLSFLSSQSIGYAVFIMSKSKGLRLLLFPLYWLGRTCQYFFLPQNHRKNILKWPRQLCENSLNWKVR